MESLVGRENEPDKRAYTPLALRLDPPSNSAHTAVVSLASLAGTTYNEEDDVVLKAKARRLARASRLERTAAIAQQPQRAAAVYD